MNNLIQKFPWPAAYQANQLSLVRPQVVNRGTQFQPQNISNIAWAFASWNHQPSRPMFASMEHHFVHNIAQYTAQVSKDSRGA